MGNLEEKNKKIIRRTRLQEALLTYVASGGRRNASAVIPEILNSLLDLDIPTSVRKSEVISSTARRLTRKGLLRFENNHYELTATGAKILEQWQRDDFKIKKPKKWDGKWRIIIFDIPEKRRRARDEVRQIFHNAGLIKLQDSVWVYPYDCEEIIGLLKTDFGVGKNMLYIIADQIENDRHLREEFGLLH